MSTPHDRLFKSTFSQPEHAIELLRSLLPADIAQHLDFATLRVESGSFIDEKLRTRFSDLLFSIRIAGRRAYLYVLCEHQSRTERFMCLRLLRYVTDIWTEHLKKHTRARYLPVVIPIVVHHGKRGWTAPVGLRDLYDAPPEVVEAVLPFVPNFRFVLDDLAPQSDEALRARAVSALPRLVLWSLKHVRTGCDPIPDTRLLHTHCQYSPSRRGRHDCW